MRTAQGLQLQHEKVALQRRLRDPADYSVCQRLGQQMRSAGIEAFEYLSARSPEPVVQLEARRDGVGFRCLDDNRVHHFRIDQFLVAGVLPQPAL